MEFNGSELRFYLALNSFKSKMKQKIFCKYDDYIDCLNVTLPGNIRQTKALETLEYNFLV